MTGCSALSTQPSTASAFTFLARPRQIASNTTEPRAPSTSKGPSLSDANPKRTRRPGDVRDRRNVLWKFGLWKTPFAGPRPCLPPPAGFANDCAKRLASLRVEWAESPLTQGRGLKPI